MKYIFFTTLIFITHYNLFAMKKDNNKTLYKKRSALNITSYSNKEYSLPSEEILRNRILDAIPGLTHFVDNTNLIKNLANKKLYASIIFRTVEFMYDDYAEEFKNSKELITTVFRSSMLTPRAITFILQDHPDAIKELREYGLMSEVVKVPNVQQLSRYLIQRDCRPTVNRGILTRMLANKILYPMEIFMVVTEYTEDLIQKCQHPLTQGITRSTIPTITTAILTEYPNAIEWMQKNIFSQNNPYQLKQNLS